ncbi:LysR substrate-binding domain-containing protein [Streptomyces sp. MB22_4]|uniref:LysR substrate-binding domain-containing protein n=1 Tax=Streptomyces sp. MB22_4 TaxID=3383120 RepID=UPI00399FBD8F
MPVGAEEIVLVGPFDDRLAGRTAVTPPGPADRARIRCAPEPVVHGARFRDRACGRAGCTPRTPVWTERSSTAARTAAAGVGVCAAPAHLVRGAVGEDSVLLTPARPGGARRPSTPARRRAAFVEPARALWPAASALPGRHGGATLTPP